MGGLRLRDRNWRVASAGEAAAPRILSFTDLGIRLQRHLSWKLDLVCVIEFFSSVTSVPFFPHPQPVTQGNCPFRCGHGSIVPVAPTSCEGGSFSCHLSSGAPALSCKVNGASPQILMAQHARDLGVSATHLQCL